LVGKAFLKYLPVSSRTAFRFACHW